jgi:hypothetical protein
MQVDPFEGRDLFQRSPAQGLVGGDVFASLFVRTARQEDDTGKVAEYVEEGAPWMEIGLLDALAHPFEHGCLSLSLDQVVEYQFDHPHDRCLLRSQHIIDEIVKISAVLLYKIRQRRSFSAEAAHHILGYACRSSWIFQNRALRVECHLPGFPG